MLSAAEGLIGFDVGPGQVAIVSAVSVRREQLAKSSRQRQRNLRPGCGLIGVGAQGARVAHRRKHTRSAVKLPRVAAQIQRMVEAPTPRCQRPPIASNSDTHVSERLATSLADTGSIPVGSTWFTAAAVNQKASHRPNDGGEVATPQERCGAAWLAHRCRRRLGDRRFKSGHRSFSKTENSAQRLGSAGRHAQEGGSPSESNASGQSPRSAAGSFFNWGDRV